MLVTRQKPRCLTSETDPGIGQRGQVGRKASKTKAMPSSSGSVSPPMRCGSLALGGPAPCARDVVCATRSLLDRPHLRGYPSRTKAIPLPTRRLPWPSRLRPTPYRPSRSFLRVRARGPSLPLETETSDATPNATPPRGGESGALGNRPHFPARAMAIRHWATQPQLPSFQECLFRVSRDAA